MKHVDIVMITRNHDLAEKALRSVSKYVPRERLGALALGWTGDDPGGQLTLLEFAKEQGFDAYSESFTYSFAKNNNRLVREYCGSEYVLFMNDDAYFLSDAVTPMAQALDDERVGTVGIRLDFPDGSIQHAGVFAAWNADGSLRGVGHIGYKSRLQFPDLWTLGSTGACMMTRRKDFLAVGGFDEGYECCFEDVQYNLEATAKLGLRNVTLNSVSAVHAESSTRKQSFGAGDGAKLAEYWARNAAAIMKALAEKPAVNSRYGRETA